MEETTTKRRPGRPAGVRYGHSATLRVSEAEAAILLQLRAHWSQPGSDCTEAEAVRRCIYIAAAAELGPPAS